MKALLLNGLLILVFAVQEVSIPKKIAGQYFAEAESFQFEDNEHTVEASSYDVTVILRDEYMWYTVGNMKLFGSYNSVEDKGGLVTIKATVSNDISIEFDVEMIVDKKKDTLIIKGTNGTPDTKLEKQEN
ncbi:MAG: hypothetical protein HUJ25_16915 [Crocinitomicaceae bacterium]|nr:hypothetical protein [Crocinitomicaceae bacterium]